jgi:hypothetical protein
MGYRKGLFESNESFILKIMRDSDGALRSVLPACLLIGPLDKVGSILCWLGDGRFAGTQSPLQLPDFTSGGKEKILVLFSLGNSFNHIADLLENPSNPGEALAPRSYK